MSVFQTCERINFFCLKNFSFTSHSTCSLEAKGLNNDLSLSLKIEWEYMPYVSKVAKVFLNNDACEPWHYVTTGCLWDIIRIDWMMEWKSCLKAEVELEQQASKVHISDPPTLLSLLTLEDFNIVKVELSNIKLCVSNSSNQSKQRSHNECPQQVLKTKLSWGHQTSSSLWSEEKDKYRGDSS